jgi:hypothetical protein
MSIPELRAALDAVGADTLAVRARVLGIGRSTCFSIFYDNSRKGRGISARVLVRMLRSPHLPASAREAVVQYATAKARNYQIERNRRKFVAKLRLDLANDNQPGQVS